MRKPYWKLKLRELACLRKLQRRMWRCHAYNLANKGMFRAVEGRQLAMLVRHCKRLRQDEAELSDMFDPAVSCVADCLYAATRGQ